MRHRVCKGTDAECQKCVDVEHRVCKGIGTECVNYADVEHRVCKGIGTECVNCVDVSVNGRAQEGVCIQSNADDSKAKVWACIDN